MKSFKLETLERLLDSRFFAVNPDFGEKYKIPTNVSNTDEKVGKRLKDVFVKNLSDARKYIISNRVMTEIKAVDTNDFFYMKTKCREHLNLPFDCVWIEVDNDHWLISRYFPENKADIVYGILIKDCYDHYILSACMSPLINTNDEDEFEDGSSEDIFYNCVIKHEDIDNDSFKSQEERSWYACIHHILDFVTKHKKVSYLRDKSKTKIMTPKGVRKVHVNEVVKMTLREEGEKFISENNRHNIEFTHVFEVAGHWRTIEPSSQGKDRKGRRCVMGRTWVLDYEKGKNINEPHKPKKKQLRSVTKNSNSEVA